MHSVTNTDQHGMIETREFMSPHVCKRIPTHLPERTHIIIHDTECTVNRLGPIS